MLLALALVAASCGLTRSGGGETLATVTMPDGSLVELSMDTLDLYHDTMEEDIDFVAGAFSGTIPPGFKASIASEMVIDALLDHLLDENGGEVDPAVSQSSREELAASIAGFFPVDDDPEATALARFDTLPYLPFLSDLSAKQQALAGALADNAPEGTTAEFPCASHILLETEEAANDVIALLDEGGDFAELAMEFSTGPTGPNGGDLGCADPSGYVVEFAEAITDAPVGTIIGPVETQFGFHVITVTGTEVNTALAQIELQSAISQIEVDVDPSIGEWDQSRASVVPPG